MTLRSNGNLLVHVTEVETHMFVAGTMPTAIPGYSLEPLSQAHATSMLVADIASGDHWLHAKPADPKLAQPHPWDQAHQAAAATDYQHFIEPDIIHDRYVATVPPGEQMDGSWPPSHAGGQRIPPDWHLQDSFTDFATARLKSTGAGIRIAHLDTGYSKDHMSKPRNLRWELAWDFVDNKADAIDPGASLPGENPGHGTATLAILAGAKVDIENDGITYSGDLGGAPDADVIPARISESVIHVASSTMAKGLLHALAPLGDASKRADVVTISHGGLPAASWANLINKLYSAGTVVVAASGDCIHVVVGNLVTHFTVYPSAFNRVVTVVGATYDKAPYVTDKLVGMQGSWGPPIVMQKALAAFTPNVPWMRPDFLRPKGSTIPDGHYYVMNGSGTSASTPQVAAAAALFLDVNADALSRVAQPWQRAEACRLALFTSADDSSPNLDQLGRGLLNAAKLLDPAIAAAAISEAQANPPAAEDATSSTFWRFLLGRGPPNSARDAMYETEVAQVIADTRNPELQKAALEAGPNIDPTPADRQHAVALLLTENVSSALRATLSAG